MSTNGKPMTPLMQQVVRLLAVSLAVALLGPHPFARAQAVPGGSPARPSVLPTGGGQALLDPSDTVTNLATISETYMGSSADLSHVPSLE